LPSPDWQVLKNKNKDVLVEWGILAYSGHTKIH
jgi:hypothetical protein